MSENNRFKNDGKQQKISFHLDEQLPRLMEKVRELLPKTQKHLGDKYKYIAYGVVVLVAAAVLAGGWYWYSKGYEEKAMQHYVAAQQRIAGNSNVKQDDIIAALKDVVAQYPRSKVAGVANYGLGNIYYFSNKFDEAIAAYDAFIDKAPSNSELAVLACIGLGFSYEAKKDYAKALASYQKAEKMKQGAHYDSTNLQNIARVYELSNERTKAVEYYQKALAKATEPTVKRFIKTKIAILS